MMILTYSDPQLFIVAVLHPRVLVFYFVFGQEIATMRMRILKKHGTGIPDVILACLTEHLKGLDVASKCKAFNSRYTWLVHPLSQLCEDKVVALIREEFGAVVWASGFAGLTALHCFIALAASASTVGDEGRTITSSATDGCHRKALWRWQAARVGFFHRDNIAKILYSAEVQGR